MERRHEAHHPASVSALPVKLLFSPVSLTSTRTATSGQICKFSPLVAGCGFPDFHSKSSEGRFSPDSVSTLTREYGRHRRARKTYNFTWAGMVFGSFEFLDLLFDNSALFVLRGEVLSAAHVHDYWFQLHEFPRENEE